MTEPTPQPRPTLVALDSMSAAELRVLVGTLLATIENLHVRIAELEARLNQHSGNSSKPPSSDPPNTPPKPPPTPRVKPRKRGGQPGHAGQTRDLVPPEQVHERVDHHPSTCRTYADGAGNLSEAASASLFLYHGGRAGSSVRQACPSTNTDPLNAYRIQDKN